MSKRYLSVLLACMSVVAFALLAIGSASAAEIKDETATTNKALLAIYGFPPETESAYAGKEAIGGGFGRNFGFGENILFCATKNVTQCKLSENLSITIAKTTFEAGESWLGGTLQSNKTGESLIKEVKHENPLGLSVQFADFQESHVSTTAIANYSDTSDRPWIATICGESSTCKVGPRPGEEGAFLVKIEDVSFNIGAPSAPTVIQGTVWGKWENSKAAKEPACIKLTLPPEARKEDTLWETQGAAIGEKAEAVTGKACILSANNNYDEGAADQIVLK